MTLGYRLSMWLGLAAMVSIAVGICSQVVIAQTLSPSYAVVIGVSNYRDSKLWPRLAAAETDAHAIADLLTRQGFIVTPLLGPQATRGSVIGTLRQLAVKIAADRATTARVVVYFAGHGTTETVGGTDFGYIVPWEATNDNTTYISMDDLRDVSLRLSVARHQLFLLDSCFGGLIVTRDPFPGTSAGQPNYLQDATRRKAIDVLTAGGKEDRVVDSGPKGHSPFTGALLEALDNGLADTRRDGFISFSELVSYVVPRSSNRYQTPGYGFLPGHALGEFLFRSPLESRTMASDSMLTQQSLVLRSRSDELSNLPQILRRVWDWCDKGSAPSCSGLAVGFEEGRLGLPKDEQMAAALYAKGCAGDDMLGCDNLADYYVAGRGGLSTDFPRAVTLYERACEGHFTGSCNALGLAYEGGTTGLKKDINRAANYFQQSCDLNDGLGCVALGFMTQRSDRTRALGFFKKACDAKDTLGCENLKRLSGQ